MIGTSSRVGINPGFFQRLDLKVEILAKSGILSAIVPLLKCDGDDQLAMDSDQVGLVLRYIVARWGAYPVAWVLSVGVGQGASDPKLWKGIGPDIFIVEDAAQAHGSRLGASFAGTMGDIGTFSFYPTKNLGGYGDGGAIVCRDPAPM